MHSSQLRHPTVAPSGKYHIVRMKRVGTSGLEQARHEQQRRQAAAEHRNNASVRWSAQENCGGGDNARRLSPRRAGRVAALLVVAGVMLAFIAQNSHEVGIELFWTSSSLPLAVLVLSAGLLGVVGGWLVTSLRPRREDAAQRDEVHQLPHRQGA